MSTAIALRTLRTAIGAYPHTAKLISGEVGSSALRLEFERIAPISKAFAPMVREGRFDVSEMAIATFLMARAHGKPIVLLPLVLAARAQEGALLCQVGGRIKGPADLAGARIAVRAYSQTTGMWLRGNLAETFGIRPEEQAWTTFEDAHVPEFRDPPWVARASSGKDLLGMLLGGEVDAAIFGNETPENPALRPVFPDPAAAGEEFRRRHGFVPVNHLVVVRREIAEREPDLLVELVRMFRAAGVPVTDRAALRPALILALRYCLEQGLLPRPLTPEEVWDGLPASIP